MFRYIYIYLSERCSHKHLAQMRSCVLNMCASAFKTMCDCFENKQHTHNDRSIVIIEKQSKSNRYACYTDRRCFHYAMHNENDSKPVKYAATTQAYIWLSHYFPTIPHTHNRRRRAQARAYLVFNDILTTIHTHYLNNILFMRFFLKTVLVQSRWFFISDRLRCPMFDNLMSIDSGTPITMDANVFVLSNNEFESIVYKEQTIVDLIWPKFGHPEFCVRSSTQKIDITTYKKTHQFSTNGI